MGIQERREREKEQVRTRIVEAARDIVSDHGLDALSMRGIAERIEYSPATIYLYFRDKDELLRSVVEEGFGRLGDAMAAELESLDGEADAREQYAATGRAYAHFALENTAYFRVMFELPTVAQLDCPAPSADDQPMTGKASWDFVVEVVQRAIDTGLFRIPDAYRGALIGWGVIHGLTSLYLSGHLRERIATRGEFLDLVEEAMESLYVGWKSGAVGGEARPGGGA